MKNKSFWISLIVFVLLMCSCKSKEVTSNAQIRSDIQSELSYLTKNVKIDTSRITYFDTLSQRIVIKEKFNIIEYDKESGKPIKETHAERETTQDTQKASAKEEQRGTAVENNDSTHHIIDADKKVDTSTKTEKTSDTRLFWFGLGFGLVIFGLFFLPKLKKFISLLSRL